MPVDLETSDRVFLTGYAGLEISQPSVAQSHHDEYVLLCEEEIIAVLLESAGTA